MEKMYRPISRNKNILYDRMLEATVNENLPVGFHCTTLNTRIERNRENLKRRSLLQYIHENRVGTSKIRVYDLTEVQGHAPLEIYPLDCKMKTVVPSLKEISKLTSLELEEVEVQTIFKPVKKREKG